jgi:hypothetical protein
MRMLLIVGLMLGASGNVYSGEKEYTYKSCAEGKNNCNECKESENKVSFKVSKSLGSVMKTLIRKDGTKKSRTLDNCKIFDEDTFECETISKAFVSRDYATGGSSSRFILSNGGWEETNRNGMYRIESKVTEETNFYKCGKEIKSIFNFFK